MTESFTLDDVITAYIAASGRGGAPDPANFVSRWPEHREEFLRFLDRAAAVHGSRNGTPTEILSRETLFPELPTEVGDYRVGRMLGRGGTSRVHRAVSKIDGSPAALKILDGPATIESSIHKRFLREAWAIQTLNHHPHIVPLLDYGRDDQLSYLALKLIRCTLAQLIEQWHYQEEPADSAFLDVPVCENRSLVDSIEHDDSTEITVAQPSALDCFAALDFQGDRFQRIADMIAAVADALDAAHQKNIVHRDVKPSNLMIDSGGHIWLTDFGMAAITDAQTMVTQTGQILGTLQYMSPEQVVGEFRSLDHRSDVYSLGATLFELVTLQRPFRGDRFRIMLDIAAGKLVRPSDLRTDVPKPLEDIILKSMSRSPADRYATAAEMAEDLRRYSRGQSIHARALGPADRAVRLLARNPKASIGGLAVIASVILLVIAMQHLSRQRLAAINSRLGRSNKMLEQLNGELSQSSERLETGRRELSRHLYVADLAAAYRAYAENEMDAVRQRLNRHIPSSESGVSLDHRGFEWWLLQSLTRAPESTRLPGHEGAARELAILPGRNELLSVGDDDMIRHWDLPTKSQLNQVKIAGPLESIAVAPNLKTMVAGVNSSAESQSLTLRELTSGNVICNLTPHQHSVESAAFSPDGQYIATAERYENVQLHSIEGRLLGQVQTGSRNESLGFTDDGKSLLTVIRDANDRSRDQSLAAWTVPDLKPNGKWNIGYSVQVFSLSADGRRIVIGHADGLTVRTWPDMKPVVNYRNVRGRVRCVAIDARGSQVLAGCDNGLIYHWKTKSNPNVPASPPMSIVTGEQRVTSVGFINEHTIVATSESGSVQAWSLEQIGTPEFEFGSPTRVVARVKNCADQLILRSDQGIIRRLNLDDLDACQTITQIPPDSNRIIASNSSGETIVADTPDGLVVLSGTDGAEIKRIDSGLPDKPCQQILFLARDEHLAVLYNDRVRLYCTDSWILQEETMLPGEGAGDLSLMPDEATLVVATRNRLFRIDAVNLEIQQDCQGRLGEFTDICVSANGTSIAVGHSDGSIELLQSTDFERRALLRGHRDSIRDCAFIDNDQTLITTSQDSTIRFWNVETGRELGVLHAGQFQRIHFDGPRNRLLCFNAKGQSKAWVATGNDR